MKKILRMKMYKMGAHQKLQKGKFVLKKLVKSKKMVPETRNRLGITP